MMIKNIRYNLWGERVGECQGRKVKWTYSVEMWFFTDTGDYISKPIY